MISRFSFLQKRIARSLAQTLLIAPFLVFIGCSGGADAPNVALQPVTGVVQMDGQPVSNVSVTLTPQSGETLTYFAASGEDGTFVVMNRQGLEGAEAGTYTVTLSKRAMPDGSPMPQEDSPEAAELAAMSVETMPAKYTSVESSPLTVEIPQGGTTLELEIEKE